MVTKLTFIHRTTNFYVMSGLDDMDSVRAVHTYSSADGSWTDKAGADGAHLLCLPRASAQLEPTAALLSPVY